MYVATKFTDVRRVTTAYINHTYAFSLHFACDFTRELIQISKFDNDLLRIHPIGTESGMIFDVIYM